MAITLYGSKQNIIQVVTATTSTNVSTSSTSYVAATGLSATITPSSASNKILCLVNANFYWGTGNEVAATIYRNGADLTAGGGFADGYNGVSDGIVAMPLIYLDSPATTSATTYAVYFKRTQGSATVQLNIRSTTSTITLLEVAYA